MIFIINLIVKETQMSFDERTRIFLYLQKLNYEQTEVIHKLVDLGLIDSKQLENFINGMVKDRFKKGKAFIEFALKLNISSPEDQPQIISRNYYGMYHIARAVVFHTSRIDTNDHDLLSRKFTETVKIEKTKAEMIGEKLEEWRKKRNNVDYDPYLPHNIITICEESIDDAKEILKICSKYLMERGVDIENV